jgi:hypothetical protein
MLPATSSGKSATAVVKAVAPKLVHSASHMMMRVARDTAISQPPQFLWPGDGIGRRQGS